MLNITLMLSGESNVPSVHIIGMWSNIFLSLWIAQEHDTCFQEGLFKTNFLDYWSPPNQVSTSLWSSSSWYTFHIQIPRLTDDHECPWIICTFFSLRHFNLIDFELHSFSRSFIQPLNDGRKVLTVASSIPQLTAECSIEVTWCSC